MPNKQKYRKIHIYLRLTPLRHPHHHHLRNRQSHLKSVLPTCFLNQVLKKQPRSRKTEDLSLFTQNIFQKKAAPFSNFTSSSGEHSTAAKEQENVPSKLLNSEMAMFVTKISAQPKQATVQPKLPKQPSPRRRHTDKAVVPSSFPKIFELNL